MPPLQSSPLEKVVFLSGYPAALPKPFLNLHHSDQRYSAFSAAWLKDGICQRTGRTSKGFEIVASSVIHRHYSLRFIIELSHSDLSLF